MLGTFEHNLISVLRNNPSFNNKNGNRRTWSWRYLREATDQDIKNYKNKLLNTHDFNDFSLHIEKDGHFILSNDDNGFINFSLEEIDKVSEIVKKGFIEKY